MTPLAPKTAVLVGGSSAIAEAVLRRWAELGTTRAHLIGRRAGKLDVVREDLAVRHPGLEVTYEEADLTDPATIAATAARVAAELRPGAVLIAHGTMPDQADQQADLTLAAHQLTVTGVSPVLWAEAFVSVLERGVIGVIGSPAGDRGRRSNYLYGASKGMIERAVQGMQHRLHGTGLSVVLIKPGPTATPMTARVTDRRLADVDAVATAIAAGMAARKSVVYAPAPWAAIMMVVRHLPRPVLHRLDL